MSRPDTSAVATLGRRIAAEQGVTEARSEAEWVAYGQACMDKLARGKPVPTILPTAPPAPPRSVALLAPSPRAVVESAPRLRVKREAAVASRPAPVLCAACAHPVDNIGAPVTPPAAVPSRLRRIVYRVALGLLWRYALLVGLLVYAGSHVTRPWLAVAGLAGVGLVLGLWHRSWAVATVWRALALAVAVVYVGPLLPVYGDIVAGSLGALTLSPVIGTLRSRA